MTGFITFRERKGHMVAIRVVDVLKVKEKEDKSTLIPSVYVGIETTTGWYDTGESFKDIITKIQGEK
ncbi:hypothetical protein ACFVL4_15290 [Bacillus subtilis]|uniref:hypothetical protein n=1 Tax=Bacillus subtilis TaxID=1423 RepID=UPI0022F3D5DF|nr:hypothetical protein [Bacillus subtilis]WBY39801.1 hypothetical protein PF977_10840 [Bacillus subtilis]